MLLLLGASLLCAPAVARGTEKPTRAVVDETGRVVRVPRRIERIISLAPNLTEMVYALGLEERLVGVTTICDFPPEARTKPKVGDVLNPSLEKIIELKPDVVLGSTSGNRRETVEALEEAGIPLYGVDAQSVEGIFASLQSVAELLAVPERGKALVAQMQNDLERLGTYLQDKGKPQVLFVIWVEPLMTVGRETFLHDVLTQAGAESITAGLEQDWPRLSLEFVIERNPDYLVLPRAYGLQARLARLTQHPPWQQLPAVEQNRIVWLDETVLRPGPRIVKAIEELARALHPQAFAQEVTAK